MRTVGLSRLAQRIAELRRDTSGVSILELALVLPVLLTLGMYGTELAYMATVNMEVSQIASSIADNASRLGQTDNSSVTPTVTEAQIDSVMDGAIQQGTTFDVEGNGRIILSSLERDPLTGAQFIHWQRCRGELAKSSAYGPAGFGLVSGTLAGLGKATSRITANAGSAVMYAEVYYRYEGLFGTMFVGNVEMKHEAAFMIRDDRNLLQSTNGTLTAGVTGSGSQSSCS